MSSPSPTVLSTQYCHEYSVQVWPILSAAADLRTEYSVRTEWRLVSVRVLQYIQVQVYKVQVVLYWPLSRLLKLRSARGGIQ